jgi:hypothetical protein
MFVPLTHHKAAAAIPSLTHNVLPEGLSDTSAGSIKPRPSTRPNYTCTRVQATE